MSIARTHHTKDYTVMSNKHFRDKRLSLKAKGLLSIMLSLPEEWDYSVKGLAALSSDGETSVRTAVKELEDTQYLKRTPIRDGGRIVDWEYDIYEFPVVGFPQLEIPLVEIPLVENKDNKVYKNKILKEANTKECIKKEKPLVKKKSIYQKCSDEITVFRFPVKLDKVVREYLSLRLKMTEKPIYATSQWKAILNKLEKLAPGNVEEQIAIVNQSIERGYASFFPVNKGSKGGGIKGKAFDDGISCEQYTPEEWKEIRKWQKEMVARGEQIKF